MTTPPAPTPGTYPPPPGSHPKEAFTPWLSRVGAYFIDILPVAVLVGIGQGILFGTASSTCNTDVIDSSYYNVDCDVVATTPGLLAAVVFGLLGLAFAVWNYGYRQGTTGSSVGKSIMNFTVVGEATGQPIGFGRSIVRQFAHLADAVIFNIGYLFPLWDAKRQTIADKLMSTVCLPIHTDRITSRTPERSP